MKDDGKNEVVKPETAPLRVALVSAPIEAPSTLGGATWIDVWWAWGGPSGGSAAADSTDFKVEVTTCPIRSWSLHN